MSKPITPLVSCETFVTNKNNEVLLVQRKSSGVWAMPGGFHDLGETPEQRGDHAAAAAPAAASATTHIGGSGLSAMQGTPQKAPAGGAPEREPQQTVVRKTKKVGRNDPCPCGSGKKYKHCHGRNA